MQIHDVSYLSDQIDGCCNCRRSLIEVLPLPLTVIPFCSSHSQWICNDSTGFWIRNVGMQGFKSTKWSVSTSNAGCDAGYNMTHSVCQKLASRFWCATTTFTRRNSWSIDRLFWCSRQGATHALYDICNARTAKQR